MQATDTIVALSTPPGRSGIGVIRLSGSRSLELAGSLLTEQNFSPEPNHVILRTIRDPKAGDVLDKILVTYFKAPHSFTGEDVVELSCHGSPPLLLHIIDILLQLGARAAGPGEFTLRALSNERINLSQAEAVRDLIAAQTMTAVQQAARQLGGELSQRLQSINDELINIIVSLESALEFVEDDLPEDVTANVLQKLSALVLKLERLASSFQAGRLLKDGLKVSLVGRPNVGKSSIFNSLLMRERAIVTDIPGTTRDSLSEVFNLNGIPILLVDTAGVRTSADVIEQLGIEKTEQAIVDADLVIVVIDGSQSITEADEYVLAKAEQSNYLIALNKSDLDDFSLEGTSRLRENLRFIPVSAKTREGLDSLCSAIIESSQSPDFSASDFLITNARHYDLLKRSAESLRTSRDLLEVRTSEELILVGLYDSLRFLGEITGETTPEDVLSQIFSTFCIGK